MLIVGVMIYVLLETLGHYYMEGVGYDGFYEAKRDASLTWTSQHGDTASVDT
jgi:hypothetical protein